MRRIVSVLLCCAGCADILGLRDPVLEQTADAPIVDSDARQPIDARPPPDAATPDANTCGWTYLPLAFDPCSLPQDNGDLVLDGGTISTDQNTIQSASGTQTLDNFQAVGQAGAACPLKLYVFKVGTLSGTINVRGACPAALVFLDDVTILDGAIIDASAGVAVGPGGDDATVCGAIAAGPGGDVSAVLSAAGGGGGGGHGATGGMGARGGGASAGNGGTIGGVAGEPAPLHGGCSGGHGGNGNLSGGGTGGGGAGGAAGGALQISSRSTVTMQGTASLRANGAGGTGAQLLGGLLQATGGGGGGGGGTIFLEAMHVNFVPGGPDKPTLCATGGGGGEGGGSALGGTGANGLPGTCSATANANGGGDNGDGGNGGDGGYGVTAVQAGRPGGTGAGGGGGGGGAAGRIILHSQQSPPVGAAVFSPAATVR